MKAGLELNMPDDRVFINFWNWYSGDDVTCQVEGDKLMLIDYDENENETKREITISEFFAMVKERMILINKGLEDNDR